MERYTALIKDSAERFNIMLGIIRQAADGYNKSGQPNKGCNVKTDSLVIPEPVSCVYVTFPTPIPKFTGAARKFGEAMMFADEVVTVSVTEGDYAGGIRISYLVSRLQVKERRCL